MYIYIYVYVYVTIWFVQKEMKLASLLAWVSFSGLRLSEVLNFKGSLSDAVPN